MHKAATLLILIFSSFTYCSGQNNHTTAIAPIKISSDRSFPKDSTTLYFPLNSWKDTSVLTSFLNKWFSAQLFALKEPIIYSDKSQDEIYRFTWLRTFHHPVAIRIEKHNGNYTLYWKLSNGAGGYKPGVLVIDKQKTLDKETWEVFINKLDQSDFWNLVTNHTDSGMDGSEWILEGKSANKYHVVDRWTPDKRSKYYECCDFLLNLTDIEIKSGAKY
jgi:hypothetical protein